MPFGPNFFYRASKKLVTGPVINFLLALEKNFGPAFWLALISGTVRRHYVLYTTVEKTLVLNHTI